MSNWMTSGSARLKAAQKNSFSRRAKKRALVVVAHNDPLMKENAATRRFPQPQPGRKSAKRRWAYGNPITRRGIAVSTGTADTCNQHYNDGPTDDAHPGYITATEKYRPSNKSFGISSESCMSHNPRRRIREYNSVSILPRRRIRDESSRYSDCSPAVKRSGNQIAGSNYHYSQHTEAQVDSHPTYTQYQTYQSFHHQRDSSFTGTGGNYHYNQHTEAQVDFHPTYTQHQRDQSFNHQRDSSCTGSDYHYNQHTEAQADFHPTYTQHQRDQSFYHQRDSSFRNNHTSNGVYDDVAQQRLFQSSRQHISGSTSISQTEVSEKQESFDAMPPDHSKFQFDNEPFQGGIPRFQNREMYGDLSLVAEGSKMGLSYPRNDDPWEHINNHGHDEGLEPRPQYSANKSRQHWQPQQHQGYIFESAESSDRTCWNQYEMENYFEESSISRMTRQLRSTEDISENASNRHLSCITNELNSTRGLDSPSKHPGIRRFKQKRHTNTDIKSGQSGFDSSCSDPVDHDENGYQFTPSSLSFFNEQNAIDISGNPLSASVRRSLEKENY